MAVANLIELSNGIHYLPGAVNIGVIETGQSNACLVIDTGGDQDHAKRLLKACRAQNLEPTAILNTHGHADHHGGNAYLQATLGIAAYCPALESAILQYPLLEPIYLWNGARPPRALQGKWLLAPASQPQPILQAGDHTLSTVHLRLLEVSGHAHVQFAVLIRDVLFAADAVFGGALLEKYPLQFSVDIARQRQSIETVRGSGARVVLPGHGDPTEQVNALCDSNQSALERASQAVLGACQSAATLPEILERSCGALQVQMMDLSRYVLNQTTVLAHLTELEERGLVQSEIVANRLLWRAV